MFNKRGNSKKLVSNSHMEVLSFPAEHMGADSEDFLVCKRKDSITVVAEQSNKILMVYQHRFACNRAGWECPQGGIEADERPEEAAKREVLEETGFSVNELIKIGHVFEAGDWCTSNNNIYFTSDVMKKSFILPELKISWFTLEEIDNLIKDNLIFDAATISTLYMYKNYKNQGAN